MIYVTFDQQYDVNDNHTSERVTITLRQTIDEQKNEP